MFYVPEKLNSITHRLVSAIYAKQELNNKLDKQNVLVIKTFIPDPDDDYEMFDIYLSDLLLDLNQLKREAERQVGGIDRIDIQTQAALR